MTLCESGRGRSEAVVTVMADALFFKRVPVDALSVKYQGSGASLMSALGQKQTLEPTLRMSALPPRADILRAGVHVRLVPKADMGLDLT